MNFFEWIDKKVLWEMRNYLFGFCSWAEHLRQHERTTVEDRGIEQAVLAFHRRAEPPVIRHLLMTNLREKRM